MPLGTDCHVEFFSDLSDQCLPLSFAWFDSTPREAVRPWSHHVPRTSDYKEPLLVDHDGNNSAAGRGFR